jgi:hypothetical protein
MTRTVLVFAGPPYLGEEAILRARSAGFLAARTLPGTEGLPPNTEAIDVWRDDGDLRGREWLQAQLDAIGFLLRATDEMVVDAA